MDVAAMTGDAAALLCADASEAHFSLLNPTSSALVLWPVASLRAGSDPCTSAHQPLAPIDQLVVHDWQAFFAARRDDSRQAGPPTIVPVRSLPLRPYAR